jgi:hypothetical protein
LQRLASFNSTVSIVIIASAPTSPVMTIMLSIVSTRLEVFVVPNFLKQTRQSHTVQANVQLEGAFGADIDYAMLVKIYGAAPEGEKRYSPAECIGAVKHRIEGNPDPKYVSTSYAERNNLNVRMHSRRLTRLTNAFSKKIGNHTHAMALHFMYYNFVRIHQTLKMTPAMAAGVTKRLWEIGDIVDVLEAWEAAK